MFKKQILLFILFISFIYSFASHYAGGELTYEYISPNKYRLTMRFYRNTTSSLNCPSSVTVYYRSSCDSGSSVTLQPTQLNGTYLSFPCLTSATPIEECIYQGIVTLPVACEDWYFYYKSCCRDPNNTLVGGWSDGWHIFAKLNNVVAPTNNSPTFNNKPIIGFCVNNFFFFDQSVSEIDGDSMSYHFLNAMEGAYPPTMLSYISPLTPQNPLPVQTPPGISLNHSTGILSFRPNVTGAYVIVLSVEEWRKDTSIVGNDTIIAPIKVGEIMRDMKIIVDTSCTTENPQPQGPLDSTGTPLPYMKEGCADTIIQLTFNTPIQCGSIEANGTDFWFETQTGYTIPVLNAWADSCPNGVTNTINIQVNQPLLPGWYNLIIKLGNDINTLLTQCGTELPEFDTIPVLVGNLEINLGPDTSICFPTDTYPVISANIQNASYQWYYNGTAIDTTMTIIADKPGAYSVNVSTSLCPNGDSDTILIRIFQDPELDLGPDINVCLSAPKPTIKSPINAATYQWEYNDGSGWVPYANGNPSQIVAINPGSYALTVTDTNGCSDRDVIEVTITQDLQVDIGPDTTACISDNYELNASHPSAIMYTWVLNGNTLPINEPKIIISETGTYSVTIEDTINKCKGWDTAIVNIEVPPSPPSISCEIIDENTVRFEWNDIPGSTGYLISEDNGESWVVPSSGQNGLYHDADISKQSILLKALLSGACKETAADTAKECIGTVEGYNVISPNDDGKNDFLKFKFLELYPGSHLVVYNRWGRKVFESDDYKNDWPGTRGKKELSNGTYFYILNINDQSGTILKGTLTILK